LLNNSPSSQNNSGSFFFNPNGYFFDRASFFSFLTSSMEVAERILKVTEFFSGLQLDVFDTFGIGLHFEFITNDDRLRVFDVRVDLTPDDAAPVTDFRLVVLDYVLSLGSAAVAPDSNVLAVRRWEPTGFTCMATLPRGFVVRIAWRRVTPVAVPDTPSAADAPQPLLDLSEALGELAVAFDAQLLEANHYDEVPQYGNVEQQQGVAVWLTGNEEAAPAPEPPAAVPPPAPRAPTRRQRATARLQRVMTLKERDRRDTMAALVDDFVQRRHERQEPCSVCLADIGAGFDPLQYYVCKRLHMLCPPCKDRWIVQQGKSCPECREFTAYHTILTPVNSPPLR